MTDPVTRLNAALEGCYCVELLQSYDWPGNVRELENALTCAAILARGAAIGPEHLTLGGDYSGRGAGQPGGQGQRPRAGRARMGRRRRGIGARGRDLASRAPRARVD